MVRRYAATGAVLALVFLSGCARGDASSAEGETPDPVTSALMNSAESPGLGLDAAVPLVEGPVSGQAPSPGAMQEARTLDLSTLGYNSGSQGAPVRVLEFSDFGCGYCRTFHQESFPVLEEEFMATGMVEWKYIPIVIGLFPNALESARAGECAGEQGRFPEMRDLLFARQREWKSSNDPDPLMVGYAQDLGLEMERFNNCVSQGWQDERIQAGTQLSREVGVRGTPTFFVVGYAPIPGAIPLELFRQVLQTAHDEATGQTEGGEGL